MNLTKLFEMQKALDERIIREKGLEGQDLFANKILALQAELAECANEWRGFKHWSNDREMRREKALEEYVDCLHFVLSIGLEIKSQYVNKWNLAYPSQGPKDTSYTIERFIEVIRIAGEMLYEDFYANLLVHFFDLGYMLGFTWDEIEQAYFAKNAVNHKRQDTGY
jgi:dimeric dUTPase (all-alpha-NTP-PPase superfamily)